MRNKTLGVLTIILLLFSACKGEETSLSSTKQLISYPVQKNDSQDKIKSDMRGSIKGSVITLSMDQYDDLKSLIATFKYEGTSVGVNGIGQESGITSNNFSRSLMILVEAGNGSRGQYIVEVVSKDTRVLSKFRSLRKDNALPTAGVSCTIEDEAIVSSYTFPQSKLIPVFMTDAMKVMVGDIEQVNGVTEIDSASPVTYQFVMRSGEVVRYILTLDFTLIPQLTITTEDPSITEVPSKNYHLNATLTVDGKGAYEGYTGKIEVKGREDSTRGYPKKPYRLKLNKKSEVYGLGKAKDYILLANHIDPTLMLNSVAFEVGQLLNIPFANHTIPVDMVLNGKCKGSYLLTKQTEIEENRVDLDENNSVIWELNSYFDRDPKFKSEAFNLPVMVKDPDLTTEQFEYWKEDFNAFTVQFAKEPLEGNMYVDMIDIESVAEYLITFNLVHNMGINHPKSIFIHKEGRGGYVMGPIQGFSQAYGYEGKETHSGSYETPLFSNDMNGVGTAFFQRFLQDNRVRTIYRNFWQDFKSSRLDGLLQYIDDQAKLIGPSITRSSELWENTRSFDAKVIELKNQSKDRAEYIDGEVNQH